MTGTTTGPVDAWFDSEFDTLDFNHDGYIDWSDYETLIGRYIQTAQIREGDRRAQALRAFYQMYWGELLRHADVEAGRLSKDQFVDATRRATNDTSRVNFTECGGHVIFDLIDINGDDQISKEELTRHLQGVWRTEDHEVMNALTALDRDGNKVISRKEFVGGIHDYFQLSRRTAGRG